MAGLREAQGRRGESFCLLPLQAGRCSKSIFLRIDTQTKFSPFSYKYQEMQKKNILRKQQVTYKDCDIWCQNAAKDVRRGELPQRCGDA